MQFLLNWLEYRREAKRQQRFEEGFSCVMVMYFHQELPLEYIADTGYQLSDAKADPWDEGYVEAIDRLNMMEEKLNGPLY